MVEVRSNFWDDAGLVPRLYLAPNSLSKEKLSCPCSSTARLDAQSWKEDFVEFLIKKAHEKKFKPREGLPLRVAPLSAAETDVYFAMLHPTPLKKRKGQ